MAECGNVRKGETMKNPFKNFKTKRQLREEIVELKKLTNLAPPLKFERVNQQIKTLQGMYRVCVTEGYKQPPEGLMLYRTVGEMIPEICSYIRCETERRTEGFEEWEYTKFKLRILVEEQDAKEK